MRVFGWVCRWGRPMRVFWVGLSLGGVWLGAREATLPPPPSPARPMRVFGVVLPSQWYRPNTLFAAQTIATNRRQVV